MQEFDFILLLNKRLTGEITESESAELDAWLEQSPQNAQLADQYRQVWAGATERRTHDFRLDMDAEFRRLLARLDGAEHRNPTKTVSIGRMWMRVAAAAAVLLMAIWGYRQFAAPVPDAIVENTQKDSGNRLVVLPDGSRVWLRQNSKIEYPVQFPKYQRRIRLTGEAYFDVTHRTGQPFRVELEQGGLVEVLGTEFNVRAESGADETCVLVRSGKVRYAPTANSQSVVLTTNDRASFSRKKAHLSLSKAPTLNELSWQTGRLEFSDTPLRHVLTDLEKHFGAIIEVQNPKMLDCEYSNTLTVQTLDEVLESFALIYRFRTIRTAPGRYRLEGGRCN